MVYLLDKFNNLLNRDGFRSYPTSDTAYNFLNLAQDKVIENLVLTGDNNVLNDDHISPLLVLDQSLNKVGINDSYKSYKYNSYSLPTNFKHLIRYKGIINNVVTKGSLVGIKNLDITLDNPFLKSSCNNLLFTIASDKLNCYYKDFVVSNVLIDYIKVPPVVNLTTDLYTKDNNHIVELAVNLYIETLSKMNKLNSVPNTSHQLNIK